MQHERLTNLEHATILLDETEGEDKKQALESLLNKVDGNEKFLKSSITDECTSPALAFSRAASGVEGIFENLEVNGSALPVRLKANYPDEDLFDNSSLSK